MGKHEKGTPKEIANRCKSKGLQKLRWFCQMCQKQCRDQNGFKCHLSSESHQRQLLLFAENPDTYLKEYSAVFEKNFLSVLRNTFGTKRVRANEVYQEYIRDKMHVHMNSTTWLTLTNFVQYLGSSGKCRVDLTEKGWFIALVDQEEEMRKQEAMQKVNTGFSEEERIRQVLEEQAERARQKEDPSTSRLAEPTERDEDGEKVVFSLPPMKQTTEESTAPSTSALSLGGSVFDRKPKTKNEKAAEESRSPMSTHEDVQRSEKSTKEHHSRTRLHDEQNLQNKKNDKGKEAKPEYEDSSKRRRTEDLKQKKTALDEIMQIEELRKERANRKDYWLHENIVVKVVTKKLGEEYYKAKGVVTAVLSNYTASVDVHGDVLKLDQQHLETVIPAIGRRMLIVNGAYRGAKALLEAIDESNFAVKVRIDEGFARGRVISVPYEDASKLA